MSAAQIVAAAAWSCIVVAPWLGWWRTTGGDVFSPEFALALGAAAGAHHNGQAEAQRRETREMVEQELDRQALSRAAAERGDRATRSREAIRRYMDGRSLARLQEDAGGEE